MTSPPCSCSPGPASALARVFAERVARVAAWQDALEGLTVIESPIINELLAERERTTKIGTLLRQMQRRYRDVPEELAATVRACVDGGQLDRWADDFEDTDSLAAFRQRTGL